MVTSLYRNLYVDMLSFRMGPVESVVSRRKKASMFQVDILVGYCLVDTKYFDNYKSAVVYAKLKAGNHL